MHRFRLALIVLLVAGTALARQQENHDYFAANRTMIRNGVQAVLMCNGLFTSHRTLEQVFGQELMYLTSERFGGMVGDADGGEYVVDRKRKAVAIGGPESGPVIRAAFRQGIGCVVMPPDQSFDDIDALPLLELPYPDMDPAEVPDGDLVANKPLPAGIDALALEAASDWAFDRDTPEQDTLSLLVVYKGDIILERYADGVDRDTRTRTWSTAKSIAVTLIGMLV